MKIEQMKKEQLFKIFSDSDRETCIQGLISQGWRITHISSTVDTYKLFVSVVFERDVKK